jgi:hypothetical protein
LEKVHKWQKKVKSIPFGPPGEPQFKHCSITVVSYGNNNNNNNNIGSTFQKDIKELDPRKAYKYLGIEESFDIQHKNEKEKLKKEIETSFGYRIKCKE